MIDRCERSKRRNLVVVRAGKNSLHPRWLEGSQDRTWDLVVSCYDPHSVFQHGPDVRVVLQPGGKWDGLHAYLSQEGVLDGYDYIWLPDDDLETCAADIDALFEAFRRYDLEVAQPALTRDSYYSHFALLACPGFRLRYTNFIEIMAPCLTTALLRQVLDDFDGSMSGFGMDYIWCRLSPNPRNKAAIIDEIAVRHTRPVGKALRLKMAKQGQVAEEEERILRARYNVQGRIRPLIYAAVDETGKRLEGCSRLGLIMVYRYLSVYRDFVIQENARGKPESARGKIVQLFRRQVTRKPDLSSLRRVGSCENARPIPSRGIAAER